MVFWVDSIGKLSNIPFIVNQDIFFFESRNGTIDATCFIIMLFFSVTYNDYFFLFPKKHLARIVYGLCFSGVNDSSITCN